MFVNSNQVINHHKLYSYLSLCNRQGEPISLAKKEKPLPAKEEGPSVVSYM
jgi:hypothetical protein